MSSDVTNAAVVSTVESRTVAPLLQNWKFIQDDVLTDADALAHLWQQLDSNQDGQVDAAEIVAALRDVKHREQLQSASSNIRASGARPGNSK